MRALCGTSLFFLIPLLVAQQGNLTVAPSAQRNCLQHMTQAFVGRPQVAILKHSQDKRVALINDSANPENQILAVTIFNQPIAAGLLKVHRKIVDEKASIGDAFASSGFTIERRVIASLDIELSTKFRSEHKNFAEKNKMKLIEFWVTKGDETYRYAIIGETYSNSFTQVGESFDEDYSTETIPIDRSDFLKEIREL